MIEIDTSLNEPQREAVLATEGPLIVLAGAGSGKTKMLTCRICHLIENLRVPPYQILAVTFTNKAAAEMRDRVQRMLPGTAISKPEISTFHSLCLQILRREIERTGFTQSFNIYDDSDQLSLIKSVMNHLKLDTKKLSPQTVQSKINRYKCDGLEPHEIQIEPNDSLTRMIQPIYETYQSDLIRNNAIDFGEIICMTYRIFRDYPDVLRKYQNRFRYIHVDEYQDTNRAQYLLLSKLASSSYQGHQNICVVGDEDQSIYKWRGADIQNILDFEQDYPGAKVVKLEQNYRSTQSILSVASQVIRNNRQRKDKTLWTAEEGGDLVIRAQLADERAEGEMVVSEIKRLAQERNFSYSDFAIFYRTNAQSRQFEDTLRRQKVPYRIFGGQRFYDRKEIKDILSYFNFLLNPSDTINLKRIINVPARGIGKTTLEKLEAFYRSFSQSKATSWIEAIRTIVQDPSQMTEKISTGTLKKLSGFVEMIERLSSQKDQLLLSELYHRVLDETRYVSELKAENSPESLSRIENLEEFNNVVQEFEEDQLQAATDLEVEQKKADLLPKFLEQSYLGSDIDLFNRGEQTDYVHLMTLHSSKGLEFPVVFMSGMEEGLFPSLKPWEEPDPEDIEEERRLCYVGMTRARQLLYLLHVSVRRIWGKTSYQEPSRFFSEIPDELVEWKDFSYGLISRTYQSHSPYLSTERRVDKENTYLDQWIGRTLLHPEYGRGKVISDEGFGTDQKITVQFPSLPQKKFLLRFVLNYFID